MSGFNDREKGFEAKFSHDEEVKFRIRSRRDKQLGLWAASKFGLSGSAAEIYANEVVAADLGHPRDDYLPEKIANDAKARGVTLAVQDIGREMQRLGDVVRAEILKLL
jgi:hypothetical protein